MMPPSELPVPRFSLAERDRRWTTVRAKMAAEGADALVCVYHTGHHNHWQGDVQYLSQIGGNNVDASLVFPLEGEPTGFVINPYYEGPAARDWMSDFRPTRRAWGDMIAERLKELNLEEGTIAISGLRGDVEDVRVAEVGADHSGVVGHGPRWALGDRAPGVEHGDPVAQRHHQAHVVLDQHHGHAAAADVADDAGEFPDLGRIEARRGLVQQQQPGACRHRPGDLDPPLRAVGE